ncbi:LuxR family transcriptional regulator [Nesterenkonia marinintestina]|uniref:AAA family ATPase n=1 Tax=Nesterenkonia marinintestina TaxID=2979865 RepID=UPI0021C05F50|nr:LuxR family transcriptional regulator [Nesterenkonia sp. GX14115]
MKPLLGRRDEFDTLIRCADDVRVFGEARLVVVQGPPGVGKTALVQEAARHMPEMRRRTVHLDPEDLERQGYGAQRLLPRAAAAQFADDESGEASAVLLRHRLDEQIAAVDVPSAIIIEGLDWLDPLSARVIYEMYREIEQVPLLSIVTLREPSRPEIRRFCRLAEASAEGERIRMEQFTTAEVRALLSEATGLPVGQEVAAQVRAETGGLPGFVHHILAQLRGTSSFTSGRRLRDALAQLHRGAGPVRDQRAAMSQMLTESSPDVVDAAAAVALAAHPLSFREIRRITRSGEAELDELRGSPMLCEDERSGRFVLSPGYRARSVAEALDRETAVHVLGGLADGEMGVTAGSHRARAALWDLTTADHGRVVEELRGAVYGAQAAGRRLDAVGLSDTLFELSRSPATVVAAAFCAMRVGVHPDLDMVAAWEESGPVPHLLRRSSQARDHLQSGDFDGAVSVLMEEEVLRDCWTATLLCFADTVLQTARTANLRGGLDSLRRPVSRVVAELERPERGLGPGAEDLAGLIPDGVLDAERRCLLTGLRLWLLMLDLDELGHQGFAQAVGGLLRGIADVGGADHIRAMLLVARAVVHRTAGEMEGAHTDLVEATTTWASRDPRVVALARIHLTYVLFDAGRWDEAAAQAEAAAGMTLAVSDDEMGPSAYWALRLVPGARGTLCASDFVGGAHPPDVREPNSMVRAGQRLGEAWRATAEEDHSRAAACLAGLIAEQSLVSRGYTAEVMLGRSLGHTRSAAGFTELLATVRSRREWSPGLGDFVEAYVTGMESFAREDFAAARRSLHSALASLDGIARPRLRVTGGGRADEGGALRIQRGLLALDIGHATASDLHAVDQDTRTAALALVDWAAMLFLEMGSTPLVRQAELLARVLRHPARRGPVEAPRRRVSAGTRGLTTRAGTTASLTDREAEIAVLVAEGRTNREVAERLVLSVRTVEFHVSNVLAKLSLDSRRELRELLRMEDPPRVDPRS